MCVQNCTFDDFGDDDKWEVLYSLVRISSCCWLISFTAPFSWTWLICLRVLYARNFTLLAMTWSVLLCWVLNTACDDGHWQLSSFNFSRGKKWHLTPHLLLLSLLPFASRQDWKSDAKSTLPALLKMSSEHLTELVTGELIGVIWNRPFTWIFLFNGSA